MHGLDLDSFGMFLYFGTLFLWSMGIAYLLVFGLSKGSGATHGNHGVHPAPAHAVGGHGNHAPPPVEATRAKPFRGFSPYEGFKSYAQGEVVTIDDIVKGIARESAAAMAHTTHDVAEIAPHLHSSASSAPARVTELLRLMVAGDRDTAVRVVSDMEDHGDDANAFLRQASVAVSAAIEARAKGTASDLNISEALSTVETPMLEELAKAFATADGGKNGAKLALTRAFSALK